MKKVAIIGLGKQTQEELVPAILSCDTKNSIEAICDVNKNVLQKFNKKFPNARPYHSYKDLFDKEKGIDCAIICVPHKFYFPISEAALQQRIAVFKEKPLARNYIEAQKISNLSDKTKTPLFTITKRAYYPSYQFGKLILPQLGNIYQYLAKHFIPNGNLYKGWRSKKDIAGGGVILDLGYHLLDIMVSYFGPPIDIHIFKSNKGMPRCRYKVEDSASFLLSHKSGIHGCFQIGCLSGPKEELLEIRGTNGTAIIKKDHVSLFNRKDILVIDKYFKTDSVFSVAKAFDAFFSSPYKKLKEYKDHQLIIMQTIDKVYKTKSL